MNRVRQVQRELLLRQLVEERQEDHRDQHAGDDGKKSQEQALPKMNWPMSFSPARSKYFANTHFLRHVFHCAR